MSGKYVTDTVWAYFRENWSLTRVVDPMNSFQNEEIMGGTLVEWATMMPEGATETQVSIGAPRNQRWREEGGLVFTAFVPSGTGTDRALTLAEALRDLFRGKKVSAAPGEPTITFRGVEPPDTATPSAVEASSGNWFGYSVSATYYCDFCRDTS